MYKVHTNCLLMNAIQQIMVFNTTRFFPCLLISLFNQFFYFFWSDDFQRPSRISASNVLSIFSPTHNILKFITNKLSWVEKLLLVLLVQSLSNCTNCLATCSDPVLDFEAGDISFQFHRSYHLTAHKFKTMHFCNVQNL